MVLAQGVITMMHGHTGHPYDDTSYTQNRLIMNKCDLLPVIFNAAPHKHDSNYIKHKSLSNTECWLNIFHFRPDL